MVKRNLIGISRFKNTNESNSTTHKKCSLNKAFLVKRQRYKFNIRNLWLFQAKNKSLP